MYDNLYSVLKFPSICRFVADGPRGGGDDPRDGDDDLARRFKIAMRYQLTRPSMTQNPYGLSDMCRTVVKRVEESGRCLFLISENLRPIAEGIYAVTRYPSDRENGGLVCHKLHERGLDLNTPNP